jgi:protein-S-isoprenylcysteine O-methyltransferase Ste14
MLKIKGLDNLRAHVPAFRPSLGIAKVAFAALGVFALTTLFFIAVDHVFAEWMPDGEILLLALGFILLARFFSVRDSYRSKFSDGAYFRAFTRFAVPGLGIIAASVAHLGYMPGPSLPDVWWKGVVVALGWLSLAIGAVLWLRSVAALGVDNLTMLFVYWPAQSRIVTSRIYCAVRHPVYSAALRVAFGLALIHANWYSILVVPILLLFCTGWIVLVEEKELINRFPDYASYRRQVPAFWPRPPQVIAFLRFIITGG